MPLMKTPATASRLAPGLDRIRCSMLVDGDHTIERPTPDIETYLDILRVGRRTAKGGPCLGHRLGPELPYVWINYDEVFDCALSLSGGLVDLGVQQDNHSKIGIYGINSPEWMMTNFATVANCMTAVPLYHTFDGKALKHILAQTGMRVVFCDNEQRMLNIARLSAEKAEPDDDDAHTNDADYRCQVEYLVLMKSNTLLTEETRRACLAANNSLKLFSFDQLVDRGQRSPCPLRRPSPDDTYMLCYTSGTTGNPKGVILTHRNVVAGVTALTKYFDTFFKVTRKDCLVSYLPLAHIYEQMVEAACFYYGGRVGYFRGDITKLMDDVKILQPTLFPIVPRLLNRLVDRVRTSVSESNRLRRAIFEFAVKRKRASLERGVFGSDTIWDKLVFRKIHAIMGGKVRFMTTASAPIAGDVLTFARTVLGTVIAEGYGQTETSGAVTFTMPADVSVGHVGGPAPTCKVKLVDVPELNYSAADDRGEICVKGPTVTSGYYKEPEKTAETIDSDGWLHTGDIGRWTASGCLQIVDRRKQIFKLAQGEYIAPEKVENVYVKCPLVAQVFVDGSGLQSYVVAVVVPDEEQLRKWAAGQRSDNRLAEASFADLCADDEAVNHVLEQMRAVGQQSKLSGIEQVKAIHLCPEPFSAENGLLTPTFKNRRPFLRQKFAKIIDQLYNAKNLTDNGQVKH